MIYIEGLESNVLTLEQSVDLNYSFEVVSTKKNGRPIPFVLNFISNNLIDAAVYGNTLKIHVDASQILNEETINLTNMLGETYKLTIKPCEYFTYDKDYTFKITSKKFIGDGSLKLKIFSRAVVKFNDEKEDEYEIGWECTYNGKPMAYSITPLEGEGGDYITITPETNILTEFEALVEFTQRESCNKISLMLTNTPMKGITKAEKKVD